MTREGGRPPCGCVACVPPAPEHVRPILVEVLVYHYRRNDSSGGCGWAELGRSHPEHVADVYESALVAALEGQT